MRQWCVETDNKGAHDLCHRFSSAQHTRHIDRKLFKLREMRGAGLVTVKYLGTEENTADLFTRRRRSINYRESLDPILDSKIVHHSLDLVTVTTIKTGV